MFNRVNRKYAAQSINERLGSDVKGGTRMLLGLYGTLRSRLSQLRNEKGASAVEYGLLVALIAVVIIAAVTLLGGNLNEIFNDIAEAITG